MTIKTATLNGVAKIEIARPEKKNALTVAMYQAMADALNAAQADAAVRAVLITGQPGIFTSGNDIEDFMQRPPGQGSDAMDSPVFQFMRALLDCDKPVVAAVTGAPSDGNRQLYSGMRRALGSNKIVIVDAAAEDVFTVAGTVNLTPIDERTGKLVVKWVLKDPAGKVVGDIEQANPVPLAAARGTWAGFGDIVASAASEGVLELLEKALNRPR